MYQLAGNVELLSAEAGGVVGRANEPANHGASLSGVRAATNVAENLGCRYLVVTAGDCFPILRTPSNGSGWSTHSPGPPPRSKVAEQEYNHPAVSTHPKVRHPQREDG